MKVRATPVLIASVLFTVALLPLIPWSLANALTGRDKMALDTLDAGFRAVARMTGDLGVICLAMILVCHYSLNVHVSPLQNVIGVAQQARRRPWACGRNKHHTHTGTASPGNAGF